MDIAGNDSISLEKINFGMEFVIVAARPTSPIKSETTPIPAEFKLNRIANRITGQSSIPVDPGKITDRLPTDMPNGYVLYEQTNLSGFVQVIYTNKAEEKLFYIKQKKMACE